MDGRSLMSSALWAVTGGLVGVGIATPSRTLIQSGGWIAVSAVFAGAGVGLGRMRPFRSKIGIPAVALVLSLAGYWVGAFFNSYQVGVAGILAGAAGGTPLGFWLQGRFTRNVQRESDTGFF